MYQTRKLSQQVILITLLFLITFFFVAIQSAHSDTAYLERYQTLRERAGELKKELSAVRTRWQQAGSSDKTQAWEEWSRIDSRYRSLFGQIFEFNDVLMSKIGQHEAEGNLNKANQIKETRKKLSRLHRSFPGVFTIALPLEFPLAETPRDYLAEISQSIDSQAPGMESHFRPILLSLFEIGKDKQGRPLYGSHFTTTVPPQALKLVAKIYSRKDQGREPSAVKATQLFRLSPTSDGKIRLEKLMR